MESQLKSVKYVGEVSAQRIIIAAYRVWVNEHRKRLELESTIKNTLLPDLKCTVLALDKHLLVKDGVKETVVTCIIEMRNLGAPSSVIGWKLIISSSEKPDISLVPCHFAADAINLANSGFTYQLNNEDAMLKKAITPIPTGGVVQGFLIFKTQIPKEELFAPGDKIELYFKDVRERLYSTGKGEISVNEANHALYFPGMNAKVIQPSPKKGKRKKS